MTRQTLQGSKNDRKLSNVMIDLALKGQCALKNYFLVEMTNEIPLLEIKIHSEKISWFSKDRPNKAILLWDEVFQICYRWKEILKNIYVAFFRVINKIVLLTTALAFSIVWRDSCREYKIWKDNDQIEKVFLIDDEQVSYSQSIFQTCGKIHLKISNFILIFSQISLS